MNNRLALFGKAVKAAWKPKQSQRKLYTDQIYPYPFKYVNEQIYPEQTLYRETFKPMPWFKGIDRTAKWGFRLFWTFWWYQLFKDPGVLLGHFHPPHPSTWTDAELGIPPDDAGSYEEWINQKEGSQ